jgi:large subunit ribosomal protein L31e
MPEVERIYTVPLRFTKSIPRTQRAKHAVVQIRKFVVSHMGAESDNMWMDPQVSQVIWKRGIQKPPARIRIRVTKFEDDFVEISLPEE